MDDHDVRQRDRSNSGRSQGSQGSKIPRPTYNTSHRPPMPQQPAPSQQQDRTRQPYGQGARTPPFEYGSRGPSRGASRGPSRGPPSGTTTPRPHIVESATTTPRRMPSRPELTQSPPPMRQMHSSRPLQAPGPTYQNSSSYKSYMASLSRRTSASHYVSDLDPEDISSRRNDPDDRVSEISSEDEGDDDDDDERPRKNRMSHIVSQASLGKKVRPVITTMGSWGSGPRTPKSNSDSPMGSQMGSPKSEHPSMEMLSAAIKQGHSTSPSPNGHRPRFSRNQTDPTHVRMPFQQGDSPLASPTSVYTDITVPHQRHDSVPLSAFNQAIYGRKSLPLTIPEHDISDSDESRPTTRLQNVSTHSPARTEKSTAQLLGLGSEQRGMSDKIPPGKRPAQLDIHAVRKMEQRGSATSLAELIRRATKVASNLDRGKTASRMGHLEMFGEKEKGGKQPVVRNSTYSEVLAAFPNPGSPGSQNKTRQTMWPSEKKSRLQSTLAYDDEEKPKRKCLGLSPPIFVLVVLIILALIAAAVLVPVFLVVIPKQKAAEASKCDSLPCLNGGINMNIGGDCSCICVSGYTGSDCSIASDPQCVSQTISDGASTYKNATMGSSIMPLLTNQGSNNVPLNASILLSTFSSNNITCAGENSLVTFGSFAKRFVIFGETNPDFKPIQLPSLSSFLPVPTAMAELPEKRQNTEPGSAQTQNGIVFASSTGAGGAATPTASFGSASTAGGGSPSTTTNAPAPTSSSSSNAHPPTDAQSSFAGAAVLYMLEQSKNIQIAADANRYIRLYFEGGGSQSGTSTVQIADKVTVDFSKMTIDMDGEIVGGS